MPPRGPVDLHVHTTASDGSDAPAEVARRAAAAGLSAIAVTDHDTLAGVAPARAAAAPLGVDVIAGVELSCEVEDGELHLLGYFVDPEDEALAARLAAMREDRVTRNARIVERLNALGIALTVADVAREAEGADGRAASLGRPHVAAALVRKGHVASVAEAFDRYLALGRPAFVPKARLAPEEAVALVRGAGGAAVLAHPFTLPAPARRGWLERLAEAGLAGVEVTYPRHDADLRATLSAWAAELDLVPTGGSDYHGTRKPDVAIGTGVRGNVHVPAAVVDALAARRPAGVTGRG